jgi:hypothetical protein
MSKNALCCPTYRFNSGENYIKEAIPQVHRSISIQSTHQQIIFILKSTKMVYERSLTGLAVLVLALVPLTQAQVLGTCISGQYVCGAALRAAGKLETLVLSYLDRSAKPMQRIRLRGATGCGGLY